MSKQELTTLLQQYFNNEITPDQKRALALLITGTPDEEQLKAAVEEIWNQYQPQEQLPAQASDAYFNRIMQTIHQLPEQHTTAPVKPMHRVPFLQQAWVRMAAAAVVIITTGTVIYFMLRQPAAKPQQVGHTAKTGNRPIARNIMLADGSQVILQPNSNLLYPASFNGPTREVTLTGEAYFDVKHNNAQPFIIHAGNIKTTVLGTAFNIKAWPTEKEVTVTVTRGKVQVENESGVLGIITPNQQISVNLQSNRPQQAAVNAEQVVSWKHQEYTLDNTTLDEALTELQMRYSTLIELAHGEPPVNCRFTASFKQDESLNYVLAVICKIYHASWKQEAGKIIITHVSC